MAATLVDGRFEGSRVRHRRSAGRAFKVRIRPCCPLFQLPYHEGTRLLLEWITIVVAVQSDYLESDFANKGLKLISVEQIKADVESTMINHFAAGSVAIICLFTLR